MKWKGAGLPGDVQSYRRDKKKKKTLHRSFQINVCLDSLFMAEKSTAIPRYLAR